MSEMQLTLSQGQHDYLVGLLETALKNTRVEEHRTRTPSFREHVEEQEQVIVQLLTQLGKPPVK